MHFPDSYQLRRFWFDHRERLIGGALALVMVALLSGAGYWWFELRWKPPPNIFDSPVDHAASYFFTDDFNQLPLEERMELIAQFIERFRDMPQAESAVLAAFLAGVTGRTREQVEENARLLLRDLMKDGADEYFTTPPDQRTAYLDQWIIKWVKFGERLERGEERAISDQERLAGIKRDAQRDEDRLREDATDRAITERDAVRLIDFWRREVETVATPKEQGQILRFMRDLRAHVGGG